MSDATEWGCSHHSDREAHVAVMQTEDPREGVMECCPNCKQWFMRMPFATWYPYCSLCAIELGIPGAPERRRTVIYMPNPPWWRRILEKLGMPQRVK